MNRSLPALVVDDFSSVSSVIARVLSTMGFHQVDIAETGEEALRLAQTKDYGLIVSDLHMKPMSGIQLLHRIKAEARTTSIPVLILTGDTLSSAAKSAQDAGAIAVVEKPPTPGELRARLEEAIGAAKQGVRDGADKSH